MMCNLKITKSFSRSLYKGRKKIFFIVETNDDDDDNNDDNHACKEVVAKEGFYYPAELIVVVSPFYARGKRERKSFIISLAYLKHHSHRGLFFSLFSSFLFLLKA